MKRIFILLSLCLSNYVTSQIEFNHSAGGIYFLVSQDGYTGGYPGITYNPRLDMVLQEEFSLSLTTYLSAAINTSMGYAAFNAPLLVQMNVGNHASSDSDIPLGFFAGLGYSVGAYSDAGVIKGMAFSGGIKFGEMRSYGLRFEFVKGKENTESVRNNIYSIGFLYNFIR